jgi:hypothetical protein
MVCWLGLSAEETGLQHEFASAGLMGFFKVDLICENYSSRLSYVKYSFIRISTMRKLTLLIDDDVYLGLHRSVGRGNIGRFIADKVRPHLSAANDAKQASAFGMLAHLARPLDAEKMAQAKRSYLQKRYARKLST